MFQMSADDEEERLLVGVVESGMCSRCSQGRQEEGEGGERGCGTSIQGTGNF